jgi:hypothetical protein
LNTFTTRYRRHFSSTKGARNGDKRDDNAAEHAEIGPSFTSKLETRQDIKLGRERDECNESIWRQI